MKIFKLGRRSTILMISKSQQNLKRSMMMKIKLNLKNLKEIKRRIVLLIKRKRPKKIKKIKVKVKKKKKEKAKEKNDQDGILNNK